MKPKQIILVLCLLALSACRHSPGGGRVIVIQPLSDFPGAFTANVVKQLKAINPNTWLRPALPLPDTAFYAARSRYRADKLISFLKKTVANDDTVVIGLTTKDISTTRNNIPDWGIMGLAYEPGRACIVSSYRLTKSRLASQLYKVAIHELGHTQGLPHCPNPECYMRDAEGGNPTDTETGFCISCKKFMAGRGWNLQ